MRHIRVGAMCGDKNEYVDGVGYSIWYPFKDYEDSGLSLDIGGDDIDNLILLLQQLRDGPVMGRFDKDGNELKEGQ